MKNYKIYKSSNIKNSTHEHGPDCLPGPQRDKISDYRQWRVWYFCWEGQKEEKEEKQTQRQAKVNGWGKDLGACIKKRTAQLYRIDCWWKDQVRIRIKPPNKNNLQQLAVQDHSGRAFPVF